MSSSSTEQLFYFSKKNHVHYIQLSVGVIMNMPTANSLHQSNKGHESRANREDVVLFLSSKQQDGGLSRYRCVGCIFFSDRKKRKTLTIEHTSRMCVCSPSSIQDECTSATYSLHRSESICIRKKEKLTRSKRRRQRKLYSLILLSTVVC